MVTILYLTLVFIVLAIAYAFWTTDDYGKAAMVIALLAICAAVRIARFAICTAVRYTFY